MKDLVGCFLYCYLYMVFINYTSCILIILRQMQLDDYRSTDDNVSTVTTYYQVSYTSYADCTSKQYTADIVKGMFVNKTENDKLTVYYNPDNPEELRPDMSHGIFAIIMSGLMLIGIIIFITKGEFK